MRTQGFRLYDPTAEPRAVAVRLAPRHTSLAGKHSSWQPTFGNATRPSRRTIVRRDGSPLRRVTDLRRS